MNRIAVVCEGHTEQGFVGAVLCPHFATLGAHVVPKLVETSRDIRGVQRQGGHVSPPKLINQIKSLCASFDYVTMMFDYYGFSTNWPPMTKLPSSPNERKAQIEAIMRTAVGSPRFIPNLIMHEFEGLLFSGPDAIAQTCKTIVKNEADLIHRLSQITIRFQSPEHINDSPDTAPSKRIAKLLPGYDKVLHGPRIAQNIGLASIRQHCNAFDGWLLRLEDLCRDTANQREESD